MMLALQAVPPVPPVPPGSEMSVTGTLEGVAAVVLLEERRDFTERVVAQGREPDRLQR